MDGVRVLMLQLALVMIAIFNFFVGDFNIYVNYIVMFSSVINAILTIKGVD